ncbi:unnamed protein product [Owenia fusiformis]|uniref:Uncharacterized protein n=1 Tax=Owenia fusiformis TaxID=6347 RepID=A0A8J1XNT1_OWEFU|nr:unnamed protein product [Owenia fusiformis]
MGKKFQKSFSSKSNIEAIKQSGKEFLSDRKHSNHLVDILTKLESEETDVQLVCVRVLHKIFNQLLASQQMCLQQADTDKDKDVTSEGKYSKWLKERYADAIQQLLGLISSEQSNLQELSLCTLMKFVASEGQNPLTHTQATHLTFPVVLFEMILGKLLSQQQNMSSLIGRFQEYVEYDDVRYFVLKTLRKQLKDSSIKKTDIFLGNVFCMLELMKVPEVKEDQLLDNFISLKPGPECVTKVTTRKEQQKIFTSAWLEFLQNKLTMSLYKKVLIILHEKVMPYMTTPVLLADFLTQSYNIGGAISLLALNGLFILVNKYNLDYPEFYSKLYSMFEPGVVHAKYRARFFHLADIFLTSTHLPAYLIAAFAKRLSRIALTAPPCGSSIILQFIYNLLIRHPNCRVLLHRDNQQEEFDLTTDPYNINEQDPAKSRAMDSSLWEIKTLQQHYNHNVANQAKRCDYPLAHTESDFGEILETTILQLIEKETSKKIKEGIPTNFEEPKSLVMDIASGQLWDFSS